MKLFQWLLISLFFLFFNDLFAQKIDHLDGVVIVENFNDRRSNEVATGSGFIVGVVNNDIYIATANHLVDNGDGIKVTFNNNKFKSFPGVLEDVFDDRLDLALVRVPIAKEDNIPLYIFRYSKLDKLKENKKVTVLGGNPAGQLTFTENKSNTIISTNQDKLLTITSVGITEGFSGGPVLEKKNNRIIGMLIRIDPGIAKVVKIDDIMEQLGSWGVPINFLVKPNRSRPITCYILEGTGLIGSYIGNQLNDDIINDKNKALKYYTDEALMAVTGETHASLEQKRQRDADYRDGLYWSALACAVASTAWFWRRNGKNNKKLLENKGLNYDPTKNTKNVLKLSSFGGIEYGYIWKF